MEGVNYTDPWKKILIKRGLATIMGLVIGDALGVPVEFASRDELKENLVTDMIGYGTHNQPAGTWSDDSSMAVATMEWLGEIETQQPDYKRLMDKFSNWILYGDYIPYQENFDCGISTCKAIMNYGRGTEPLLCGEKGEFDNGNGSLMRILPAALYYGMDDLPKDWLAVIPKKEWIMELAEKM